MSTQRKEVFDQECERPEGCQNIDLLIETREKKAQNFPKVVGDEEEFIPLPE